MTRPLCVQCRIAMERVRAITVVETMGRDCKPYKLHNADLCRCKSCRLEVVLGFGEKAFAEYFQADFKEQLAKAKDVVYWNERTKEGWG
jgi:hypothetical protein